MPDVKSLPPDLEIKKPLEGPHPHTGIENLVMEGGGSKGAAYIGALLELQERGTSILMRTERISREWTCRDSSSHQKVGRDLCRSHREHAHGCGLLSRGGDHAHAPLQCK